MKPAKQSLGRTKHLGGCAEDCDFVAARRVPRLPGREAASMPRERPRQSKHVQSAVQPWGTKKVKRDHGKVE
jgi:hypothetical protein